MPKPIRWLLICMVILVVVVPTGIFGVWFYGQAFLVRNQIDNQLQQVINRRDQAEIEKISLDQATVNFFTDLPSDARVDAAKTSDAQGGRLVADGFTVSYYVAVIGTQPINVYVKVYTDSFIHRWLPKVILYKVSIDHPGTIAENGEIIEDSSDH